MPQNDLTRGGALWVRESYVHSVAYIVLWFRILFVLLTLSPDNRFDLVVTKIRICPALIAIIVDVEICG